MADLQQFRNGHLLRFMSSSNQARVARHLALLQARQYAPATLKNVVIALKALCDRLPPQRGRVIAQDLTQTTPEDIDAWLHASHEKGLAPGSIRSTLNPLRSFFTGLLDDGLMSGHPIRRRRHDVIVPQSLPRPMAETDIIAFFRVIDSLRDRLMFLLMLRCGLRLSEMCHLIWAAINWEAGSVRIDHGKDHVDRVVYYTSDVEQALRQWQRLDGAGSDYLFPSPVKRRRGQPLSLRYIQVLMTRYCQQAQISTHYSPHCLRHSFATELLNAGASLEVVSELMGHRHISMTLRYTQLYDSNKRHQYDQAMAQVERRQSIGGR
jgi:site-specific recombinase XerD